VGCFDQAFLHEYPHRVNKHLHEIKAFFGLICAPIRPPTNTARYFSRLTLEKVGAFEKTTLAAVRRGGEVAAVNFPAPTDASAPH
jgi:hypothetical protein